MVNYDDSYTTRLNPDLEKPEVGENFRLELFYRGTEFHVGPAELPFKIGRDIDTCNMVIGSEIASRNHCEVIVRDGQVGILDTSTNGTVIKIGRADNVVIKEKFFPLTGQGYMKLGEQIKLDDPNLIMFKVIKDS